MPCEVFAGCVQGDFRDEQSKGRRVLLVVVWWWAGGVASRVRVCLGRDKPISESTSTFFDFL